MFEIEISMYPQKLQIISYLLYEYGVDGTKTHKMRPFTFGLLIFSTTVSHKYNFQGVFLKLNLSVSDRLQGTHF